MPMPLTWNLIHPRMTIDHLGFIPQFIYEDDPRPAAQQFDERYVFGGWSPFEGFAHLGDGVIQYPDDPPYTPLASATLRDEVIRFYPHAWVGIFQLNGTFEISRMD